jgi:transposase
MLQKSTGRKLAIHPEKILSMAIYKQRNGIPTKKAIYEMFEPKCSYKTLVVSLNRLASIAAMILLLIMKWNKNNQHPIKHIDSTSLEVCRFKNANKHRTMKQLSAFSKNKHGTYFGLKLHIISDFNRKILEICFTPANIDDRKPVMGMSKDIWGILIGDAGYISKKLEQQFHEEGKRLFMAKPRSNMKKLATEFQLKLYDTRAKIELNFRNLKLFNGLITSLPRSAAGYFANYIYSLLTIATA